MSAAAPVLSRVRFHKSNVCLMDERSWIQGLARGLRGHPHGGELSQLVVDEREQVSGGVAVTAVRSFEKAEHIGHTKILMNFQVTTRLTHESARTITIAWMGS